MGQKHSTKNWSVDDWAFGTGENAVPLDAVLDEAKTIPARYFGGRVIGNDPSMQQMQNDLLSFDDVFKHAFRRKKNKQPASQDYVDEQYYAEPESQVYYDQNQQSIPEEDEEQIPSDNIDNDQPVKKKKKSWKCKQCNKKNKSTNIVCRQCG